MFDVPRLVVAVNEDGLGQDMRNLIGDKPVMVLAVALIGPASRLEALYLGEASKVSNGDLRDAIQNLLGDQLERVGMSRCARYLIDGRGPDRMVNALEIMLHPAVVAGEERLAA